MLCTKYVRERTACVHMPCECVWVYENVYERERERQRERERERERICALVKENRVKERLANVKGAFMMKHRLNGSAMLMFCNYADWMSS